MQVNWFDAFMNCRYMDMELAIINSKEENDQVIKQIKDEGNFKQTIITLNFEFYLKFSGHEDKHFWIGGTKLGKNSTLYWMGNGKPVIFADWAPGQPDNLFYDGEHEKCLQIFNKDGWRYPNSGLKWNDVQCSHKLNFICEQNFVQYNYCTD